MIGKNNIHFSFYGIYSDQLALERERERETVISEVHRVKLSRRSCMINVLSLYDSSPNVSSSEIASSKACQIELPVR